MAEHADLKYDYKHHYVLGVIHFFFQSGLRTHEIIYHLNMQPL